MQAALAVVSGRLCILVRPGLSDQRAAISIRSLLAHYINRPFPLLLMVSE